MIYDISCKTLVEPKPFLIRLDEIDGFIIIYEWTRYLTSFDCKKYDAIYDRIRYPIRVKNDITCVFSHVDFFAKIKVNSYDFCENNTHQIIFIIILMKSVLNKNKNHYYSKIFLKKFSCQSVKK